MGVKMNAQNDANSAYVQAVNEITTITARRALRPWLHLDFIFYMTTPGRRYKKCLEVLHGTTDRVIRERREELLKMGKDHDHSAMEIDDIDIREEVDTFMFEGHDTTEAAISFAIYLLACHSDVQEKVLEELKSVFDWSQPLQPTIQQLGELKYLEMVIKEALRLYPPVAAILRDITNDEKLPSSQRFAMLEMKSVLAKVIWNFEMFVEPGFTALPGWKIILKSINGVRIRLEDRRTKYVNTGEKWRSRRKALTPTFHFRILEQFAPVFLSCGDEFVRQLRKRAGGDTFDVVPLIKLLTLDIICGSHRLPRFAPFVRGCI
ncbi:Probable cytochrome P450 4d20 [Gryllus bimaculatus]|nr:Probable cytochrome P450 4d20 [Gryllus bimaculatus]